MRRACGAAFLALALAWPTSAAAVGSHAGASALVTWRPETPRVGRPWRLTVRVTTADRMIRPGRRVRVIGEMTGHSMRPVEADLDYAAGSDEYVGRLTFTMRGPWQMTVRAEDGPEVLAGGFALDVADIDAPEGALEMRAVVGLAPPVRPNLLPPQVVVALTLALVVAFELTTVWARRRRALSMPEIRH